MLVDELFRAFITANAFDLNELRALIGLSREKLRVTTTKKATEIEQLDLSIRSCSSDLVFRHRRIVTFC